MNTLTRRDAVKAVAVGAVGLGGAIALGEDVKAEEKCHPYRIALGWGAVAITKPTIHDRVVLHPPNAKNAVNFNFAGATVTLGEGDVASNALTVISFTIPVSLPEELPKDHNGKPIATYFIGYNHFIKGTLSKDKDARIVIIADVAGLTKHFEFPFGIDIGDAAGTQIPPDFNLGFFSAMNIGPTGDPQKYAALEPYAASLVVSVTRRDKTARVHVAIDTLDVEATYSAPDMPV